MSASSESITLPLASIQHDFLSVVSDVDAGLIEAEDIWLSCYRNEPDASSSASGSGSVHGKVKVTLGETSRKVELHSKDGVGLKRSEDGKDYTAECASLGIRSTPLRLPRHTVEDDATPGKSNQLSALAVSPDLTQVALGYEDGTIRRLPIRLPASISSSPEKPTDPTTTMTYSPHMSITSITVLKYFPSSQVLLSAGADFSLHILDASPTLSHSPIPSPIRSLRGHIRAISDVATIEKGKNVLSCGRDGTVRLWDVGGGQQIRMMGTKGYAAVNAMSFGTTPNHYPPSKSGDTPMLDEREVGTSDKLAFLALQSGSLEAIDLRSKSTIFDVALKTGPLVATSYDCSSFLLAAGSTSGVVTIFDVRSLSSDIALCSFRRNGAGIAGLAFTSPASAGGGDEKEPLLAVTTTDGLPFLASIRPNGPDVASELVGGGDCEPCRVLDVDSSGNVWVGGDEGVLRIY